MWRTRSPSSDWASHQNCHATCFRAESASLMSDAEPFWNALLSVATSSFSHTPSPWPAAKSSSPMTYGYSVGVAESSSVISRAAAFTSSAYGYPAGSYGYKYMRRLVGHLRQSDKGKSNHEAWWNQMHDVPAPPPRSTASMADGSSQDAAAEARLAEMLGCAPPHSSRSRAAAEETPHDGDCDVNLMMKLEEWGLPHDFTVRAFKTFPFNHASASYAILEGKMLAQRE